MSLRDYDGGYGRDSAYGRTAQENFHAAFPSGYGSTASIICDWIDYGYKVIRVDANRVIFDDRGPVAVYLTGIVEELPGTCHQWANPNDKQYQRRSTAHA